MLKPALTAEEWDYVAEAHIGDGLSDHIDRMFRRPLDIDETLHAAAAIALHDCRRPVGFTRADVRWLRANQWSEMCQSIADRIEALLPPENA